MTEYKFIKIIAFLFLLLQPLCSFAQQVPQNAKSEQEEEKQLFEAIDKQIEDWEAQLKLEDWQVFYVDSIMHHDYTAMRTELKALSDSKIGNTDAYFDVQDKWMEKMYNAYHKVFDEAQWNKYLKIGAAREKKARDKRAEKHK